VTASDIDHRRCDANGNLDSENASGTLTTNTWNDENQLTQVEQS
jgi:hypothetical protein